MCGNMPAVFRFLVLSLAVVFTADATGGCPLAGSQRLGLTCYLYRSGALGWMSAESNCAQMGGHLAAVRSTTEQTFIEGLMRQDSAAEVWIGAREVLDKHWTWSMNGQELHEQGCYKDDEFDRDLQFEISPTITDLTPSKCIEACQAKQFRYAGTQEGWKCFCGNDFGRHGLVQGCTVVCTGDTRYKCGGWKANFVYKIGGASGEWSENQPSNFGGDQLCGGMRVSHQYKFSDESCGLMYQYLCSIPTLKCDGQTNLGRYIYLAPLANNETGRCYFAGEAKMSWPAARQSCHRRGGHLAALDTDTEFAMAVRMLTTEWSTQNTAYVWIGLTKKTIDWSSGSFLTYSNWADRFPTRPAGQCVLIDGRQGYKWRDETCTLAKSYYCQWDLDPPTTTPPTTTTTPTTTTPTTTTPTTTTPTNTTLAPTNTTTTTTTTTTAVVRRLTTTTQAAAVPVPAITSSPLEGPATEPNIGASTALGGSSQITTILIVVVVILIILMIVTISLLIYYNVTRSRRMKVGVETGVEDDTRQRTIKYNIYEPPSYENVADLPTYDTAQLAPNLEQPALQGYTRTRTMEATVPHDYDVPALISSLQTDPEKRRILTRTPRGRHESEGAISNGTDSEHKPNSQNNRKKRRPKKACQVCGEKVRRVRAHLKEVHGLAMETPQRRASVSHDVSDPDRDRRSRKTY